MSEHTDHSDHADHGDVPHADQPHADYPHGDATPSPHVDLSHIDFHPPQHLDWGHLDRPHNDLRHGDFGPPTDEPLERFSRRMVSLVEGVEQHIASSHNVLAQQIIQGIANVSASLEELRKRVEALERERQTSGPHEGEKGGPT